MEIWVRFPRPALLLIDESHEDSLDNRAVECELAAVNMGWFEFGSKKRIFE